MRRRSYTLPIVTTIVMIACVVFLISVFLQSPYEKAMKDGDKAMENGNYTRAVSEYTIAQNLDSDRLEAYEKGLNAIVLLNSNTVERDFLSTVNSCIEFCGENSIKDVQIVNAIDILIASGNTEAACGILEHLHQSYSGSKLIKEKTKLLNIEAHHDLTELPSDENIPASSDQQMQSEIVPQFPLQQTTEYQTYDEPQAEDNGDNEDDETDETNETDEVDETAKPSAAPSHSPAPTASPSSSSAPTHTPASTKSPSSTKAPSSTQAPAPTQAPQPAESKSEASEAQQVQTEE